MGIDNIRKVAFSGVMWQFASRIGSNGIQFLTYLILARLLQPQDFGIIAIVGVFINFSNILVNSGLGTALVQSKKVDEIDYSTVLYVSVIISLIFYTVIFFAAPYIAEYYHQEAIVGVLRIYSISIILFAINGVQTSIILRKLEFKKISIISSIPVVISGIISILMAFSGFGIYALVANSISSGLISIVLFSIFLKWVPKRVFSIGRIKNLFSFGYKMLLGNLIEEAYKSIYPLIIGKVFSAKSLGFYNLGRQIPSLVTATINASVTSVAFPLYSHNQDDNYRLKTMVRQSLTLGNFVIFPIVAGIAALADQLVPLLFTEKWLPSVPYLQLFCIIYGLSHLDTYNFHAISAIGKSSVFLKYQIIKKILGVVVLLITLPFGIKVIMYGQVILAIISIIINFKPNFKWLNYNIKEQLNDIWPYLLASIIMFVGISLSGLIVMNLLPKLIIEAIIGLIIYLSMAFILKLNGFQTLVNTLKSIF
jgi:O-antigen/teichoic acid export membrane protein